jgi:pimeloyl-ACP methyl ester carboxylesterase
MSTTDTSARSPHADFFIEVEQDIHIFVREIQGTNPDAIPIILVHGARVPGLASFDLDAPQSSVAQDLAAAGHAVYIFDARGYGSSSRPRAMDEPPRPSMALTRSNEVVRDLIGVVEAVCGRTQSHQVALLGWATGGMWAGHYASLYPERVSHFVAYNTLYGGHDGHPLLGRGSPLEDSAQPGRFDIASAGSYQFHTADSLRPSWDNSIPAEQPTEWRDPRVIDAYVNAALASDSTAHHRSPPSFRAPTGAMEDSFLLASGHQVFDASTITAHTLIVRSERDFWSRPEDVSRLSQDLHRAANVRQVLIPRATHFVHLDRPGAGRAQFLTEVLAFVAA